MRPSQSRTHLPHPARSAPRVFSTALAMAFVIALSMSVATAPPSAVAEQPHDSLILSSHTTAATPPTSGLGTLTPEMRAEIERVVAAGSAVSHTQGRVALARAAARCANFEGQRYCLGVGWTSHTQGEVAARLALQLATRPATRGERTGDLDAAGLLARATQRSEKERVRVERAELTRAAQAVGKVWMLRHEIQGVPMPSGFAQRHPEVAARGFGDSYPANFAILKPSQVRSQSVSYWCGPTTMQAIGWGAANKPHNQSMWARRLHTTTAGTSITDMVRVVNANTD